MLKEKINSRALPKFICLLPMAALVVSVFANPDANSGLRKTSMVEAASFTVSKDTAKQSGRDSVSKDDFFIIGNRKDIDVNPMLVLDGKEITPEELNRMNPDSIKSFSILGNKEAIDSYGEKGKKGVVLISTKKQEAPKKLKQIAK